MNIIFKISDKNWIKLSFIFFLLSFSLIFYIDSTYELKTTQLKDISIKNLNQFIKIDGKIIYQKQNSNTFFFKIDDKTSTIDAIIFNYNQTLDKNKNYIFEGKITYYNEKLGLIIDKVIIKN